MDECPRFVVVTRSTSLGGLRIVVYLSYAFPSARVAWLSAAAMDETAGPGQREPRDNASSSEVPALV